MNELTVIANKYGTDKGTVLKDGSKGHGYTELYYAMFNDMRDKEFNMLEIGVCDKRFPGASVFTWIEFFKKAMIYGFDIKFFGCHDWSEEAKCLLSQRFKSFTGNAGDEVDLLHFKTFYPVTFDIIIDDGSHYAIHQQPALKAFYSLVNPGGWYVIEDVFFEGVTKQTLLEQKPSKWLSKEDIDNIYDKFEVTEAIEGKLIIMKDKRS